MHTLKATAQPEALLCRAESMIDEGHTGAARALLAAALRLGSASPRQAELGARLAMREGRFEQARQGLDAAIADTPTNAGLRKLRAELRQQLGDIPGAAADAAEAVVLDRHDPIGKALLGVVLLELRRPDDAVACLREALAVDPANPAFREALAAACDATGDPDAALAVLTDGIIVAPRRVSLRNAAVLHCVRRRDFTTAVRLAEEARTAGAVDACLFGLKGHALSSLGRHEEAADAYAEALKLGPEDPYVRHLVAATGMLPGAARAPAEYVRAVFDGYAEGFDQHLVALGYRVPGLIRTVLREHNVTGGPVLDLGCGTGLLALTLSDLNIGPFVGVDVSSGMLARAALKHLYAELHEADVLDFLGDDERRWPLVLAGDVLCYFGALDAVLNSVQSRLAPGGLFVFSVELLQPNHQGVIAGDGDWSLGAQGRYAHAEHYVARAAHAAGLVVRQATPDILRNEADAPVPGLVLVLEDGIAH